MAIAVLGALGYVGWQNLGGSSEEQCKDHLEEASRLQRSGDPRAAQGQIDLALHACSGPTLERAQVLSRALQPAIRAQEACDRAKRDAESQIAEGRLRQAQKLLIAQPTSCASRADIVQLRQSADDARKGAADKIAQAFNQANQGQADAARELVNEAERLDRDNPDLARMRKTIEIRSRELAAQGAPAVQPATPSEPPSPTTATTTTAPPPPPAAPPAAAPAVAESALPMAQLLAFATAGNWPKLDSLIQAVKAMATVPPTGDRRASRAANTEALALLRSGHAAAAVPVLRRASVADPSDVEVANNLGFAQMQAGQLKDALATLERVISMAPDRTSAWANYSETLATGGNEPAALAALRIAMRHSADRQKSVEAMTRVRDTHPNATYVRVVGAVLNDIESIPRSPTDRSRDPAAATATGPGATAPPAPSATSDAKRIECEVLVRSGQRALAGRSYDVAMQHADEALAVLAGCPGAQELARNARQAKDQARAGVVIR